MQLLETLCFQNGEFQNIDYHLARFENARKALFGLTDDLSLEEKLIEYVSTKQLDVAQVYRCRVLYGHDIEKIELVNYQFKKIERVKLFQIPYNYDYGFKWAKRSFFATILAQQPDFDEVLMVQNNRLTDITIANIALFDGKKWITPAHPLLKGTKRQFLLDSKMIEEGVIEVQDLQHFQRITFINTFRGLENSIAVSQIEI